MGVDAGAPAPAAPAGAKATPLVAACSLCGSSARRPLQGNLKFLCLDVLRAWSGYVERG